ncbi:TIGR02391 family protein [Mycobacteroides abscessus]|uniref:TIGR02391 family protein n=1 Tax=Mycobacteroides abscessus TaxID=36809 RepID=UPI0009A849F4|nr:TIGR02391 family protein [Mycobacteroides abscessus]
MGTRTSFQLTRPGQANSDVTYSCSRPQRGIAQLAKGTFAAFRNPAGHEPRLKWSMTEQDALDVMGTLSMIHRRLDTATLRPSETL